MSKLLYLFSWIVATYFGIGFIAKAGFPPKTDLLIGDALFVGLFLFFLFLPFFNKIKVGSWLELEREIKEAKKEATDAKRELTDFKTEVRNTLNVVSTQRTNVYVNGAPNAAQLREQQATIATKLDATEQSTVEKYEETVKSQESDDVAYVLAKVRIDIERLLRAIVGKRIGPAPTTNIKLASARQLFDSLVHKEEAWEYLRRPFEYVNRVCNAAIHGQIVSAEQSDEALKLGAQIIAALKQHPNAKGDPV
ncbi:hypothetical protein [Methylibium petroleiphilum]|uniref:hypothetical protein n=1 Tax=Methylibium petroleiphilum TaxID=105560 RepID=UPI003D2E3E92